MSKVIAVSNHKGGVGKTTSVVNIGAGLSRLGKRVLLVDLDAQANLTQSLGIDATDLESNIYTVLVGRSKVLPINITEGLELIPSTLDLSGAEVELVNEVGKEYILREVLQPLRKHYDYILIDCPPSLGLLTINALTGADEVLIPLQAEYLATQGLTKLREVVDRIKKRLNKKLTIGGVLVTQYDQRKVLNRNVAETLKDALEERVYKTRIRENVALAEAPARGLDIFRYQPNSYGAEDYLSLCKEIIKTSVFKAELV